MPDCYRVKHVYVMSAFIQTFVVCPIYVLFVQVEITISKPFESNTTCQPTFSK